MKEFPDELLKILDILKASPRGMSVSDIAGAIGINRNTVSRYLDMLLISGQVDMKTYGKAKVFFISQRVPISTMLNLSSEMVIVLDRNLIVLQANDTACKFAGTTSDEIGGKRLRDSAFCAFDHPMIMSRIRGAMEGTESVEELRFLKVDGEKVFRVKIIPTVFNDGTPGVTMMLEDITEEKRAEEALRESENTYRSLVEEIKDAIWNLDEDCIFTYVSPRTTAILGYSPDEMVGKALTSFMSPDEAEGLTSFIRPGGEPCPDRPGLLEFAMLHRDGHKVYIESSGTPCYDEIGDYSGYRVVCRDISERKKAAKRVSQWKSFLQSIVQNIPAMVMVWAFSEGDFIFFNHAAEEAFGDDCGSAAERLFGNPGRLADLPVSSSDARITISGEGKQVFRTRTVLIPAGAEKPKYVLCIADDVTEQIRAGALLKKQRDQAQSYLDVAGVMIAVIESDGTISRINRRGCQLLGYSEDELTGMDWFSTLVPDNMSDHLRRNFSELMSGSAEPPAEERGFLVRKDGHEVSVLWHNSLLRDDDGRPVAMVSSGDEQA